MIYYLLVSFLSLNVYAPISLLSSHSCSLSVSLSLSLSLALSPARLLHCIITLLSSRFNSDHVCLISLFFFLFR